MRNVSLAVPLSGSPTASALTLFAASMKRSSSTGDTPSTSPTLSKPYAESSGGSSVEGSTSSASRSRIAFAYSARFRRCRTGRPGLGLAVAARSSDVVSHETSATRVPASGCGALCGGIIPTRTFLIAFSQTSAPVATSE